MSDISTCKQLVDMDRFGPSHDQTFHKRMKKRPGKTMYVWRDGQLMVREDGYGGPIPIIAIPTTPDQYLGYAEQLERMLAHLAPKSLTGTE